MLKYQAPKIKTLNLQLFCLVPSHFVRIRGKHAGTCAYDAVERARQEQAARSADVVQGIRTRSAEIERQLRTEEHAPLLTRDAGHAIENPYKARKSRETCRVRGMPTRLLLAAPCLRTCCCALRRPPTQRFRTSRQARFRAAPRLRLDAHMYAEAVRDAQKAPYLQRNGTKKADRMETLYVSTSSGLLWTTYAPCSRDTLLKRR
jgi:hypothetical protein